MPETDLSLLIDTIRDAGELARSYAGGRVKQWDKGDNQGPVTEADLAVNNLLKSRLTAARPNYGWLSEESDDDMDRLLRDRVFIVDPIDGTRSFIEGSDIWAHSLAIAEKGQIIAGVVYLPMRDRLFVAAKGKGASLNGCPIRVSNHSDPDGAVVLASKPSLRSELWKSLPDFKRSFRPSLAYRLSLIGQGRFDAMLTFRPTWEWDIAAGDLIVQEAGGRITDPLGNALIYNSPKAQLAGVVAANPALHGGILQRIHPIDRS